MNYYSDPTASQAIGNLNRDFSKQEKKAKNLLALYKSGEISSEELRKAHSEFKGIYKNVLKNVIIEDAKKQNDPTAKR